MRGEQLFDLQRFRSRIVKEAQRENDHVRLVAEQLHVSSTLRRLDELEQKLEALCAHFKVKLEPISPRVTARIGDMEV